MPRHPHGETVVRIRAIPTVDPYSGEATDLDWSNTTELDITGVAVEPRPSTEPVQDARNATVSGFTLYMDAGADMTPADRVEVRGGVYAIEGEPDTWTNPFTGQTPGMVVQTKRVEG